MDRSINPSKRWPSNRKEWDRWWVIWWKNIMMDPLIGDFKMKYLLNMPQYFHLVLLNLRNHAARRSGGFKRRSAKMRMPRDYGCTWTETNINVEYSYMAKKKVEKKSKTASRLHTHRGNGRRRPRPQPWSQRPVTLSRIYWPPCCVDGRRYAWKNDNLADSRPEVHPLPATALRRPALPASAALPRHGLLLWSTKSRRHRKIRRKIHCFHLKRSVNQSINQSVLSQSINQSINQSMEWPINQSIKQSIDWLSGSKWLDKKGA